MRGCSAWQPCLGLLSLRADTGQSLCDFSYYVVFVSVLIHQVFTLTPISSIKGFLGNATSLETLNWSPYNKSCRNRLSPRSDVRWEAAAKQGLQHRCCAIRENTLISSLHWPDIALYNLNSNRFTFYGERAELNDFVSPWSFEVYWHFLHR